MANRESPCSKQRELLLEIFLSDGESANLPCELNQHLQGCAPARIIGATLVLYGLHTHRTGSIHHSCGKDSSDACPKEDQAFKIGWVPMIIFAALLSLSFSFVLPVWLMAKLFMYWTSSIAVACGAALAILLAGGTLVTVVSAISLMERGYIHFGDEESERNTGRDSRQRPARWISIDISDS